MGTREVVINACYGGFGLSYKGVMAYAKEKGIELYPYVNERTGGGINNFEKFVPYDGVSEAFLVYYFTAPLCKAGNCDSETFFYPREMERDDPYLVKVVKELGAEANGPHAKLKVVEIPDDVKWEIDEYDGFEHIDEDHRSWS